MSHAQHPNSAFLHEKQRCSCSGKSGHQCLGRGNIVCAGLSSTAAAITLPAAATTAPPPPKTVRQAGASRCQEGGITRRGGARSAPPLRHSAHQKRKNFGGRGAMEASRNRGKGSAIVINVEKFSTFLLGDRERPCPSSTSTNNPSPNPSPRPRPNPNRGIADTTHPRSPG